MYKKNFKIGIFWEQFEWGGVDTHIKYLLEGWVGDQDQFIIYYNKGNQGAVRFKNETNLKEAHFIDIYYIIQKKIIYFSF